jgi:tetrahydromethanopterin S-methyltransferase subunit B
MGIVRISSELGLSFDPLKGMVAEERDDVVQYALDPIIPMVERLDHIADDLVNQLGPDSELMESYAFTSEEGLAIIKAALAPAGGA